MRNLVQYPVTQAEKLAVLERAMTRELSTANIGGIGPAAIAAIRSEVLKGDMGAKDVSLPFMKKLVERHNALFRNNDVNVLEEQRARQQAIQESELMFRQIENLLSTRRAV